MKVLIDNSRILKAAKKRYEYFIADEKARIAYLQREKFLRDQANYIHTARLEGHAEGTCEKAVETTQKLKNMGLSVE